MDFDLFIHNYESHSGPLDLFTRFAWIEHLKCYLIVCSTFINRLEIVVEEVKCCFLLELACLDKCQPCGCHLVYLFVFVSH